MSYNLAVKLGFNLKGGIMVTLANGTNVELFIIKEEIQIVKKDMNLLKSSGFKKG